MVARVSFLISKIRLNQTEWKITDYLAVYSAFIRLESEYVWDRDARGTAKILVSLSDDSESILIFLNYFGGD